MAPDWNAFVAASRNGTFLFDRGYMDYHADRFADASVVLRQGARIVGLLPATRQGDVLSSHAGLTYGGLVIGSGAGLEAVAEMLAAVQDHARGIGCARLHYKTIPALYHRSPAGEDQWALIRGGARLVRRDPLAVIVPGGPGPSQARRADLAKAARRGDVTVARSEDWAGFWAVLTARLADSHATAPVHSLAEITQLAARFPQAITLWTACRAGQTEAGVVLFDTQTALHCQYIAATDAARAARSPDLVMAACIAQAQSRGVPFDFGSSTEAGGTVLNAGLQRYKESFGARCVLHDYYDLDCRGPR